MTKVSWNNPNFITPRMEELSRAGVRLNKSYVSPKCSPSRAALMTGIYPWRLGLQRQAIGRFQATGLDPSKTLLPEHLQKEGYTTHLVGKNFRLKMCFFLHKVGKWHLGFCNERYLPTNRGFKTFFGQYNHACDYYTRYF